MNYFNIGIIIYRKNWGISLRYYLNIYLIDNIYKLTYYCLIIKGNYIIVIIKYNYKNYEITL